MLFVSYQQVSLFLTWHTERHLTKKHWTNPTIFLSELSLRIFIPVVCRGGLKNAIPLLFKQGGRGEQIPDRKMSPKESDDDNKSNEKEEGEKEEKEEKDDAFDTDWIEGLDPTTLEEGDIAKLVSMSSRFGSEDAIDGDLTKKVMILAMEALKSRDADLNEAMEALANKEEEEALRKENKELKAQVKKLKRVKAGQGGAMEDLLAVEQDLEQARKEASDLERDLDRERRAKEDLESRLEVVDKERQNLRREVEGLRDEVSDLRRRVTDDNESVGRGVGDGEEDPTTSSQLGLRLGAENEDKRRLRELEETVRMKNKQIHQLLEDIDQVEKDGVTYQNKVVDLRDQLAEATKQINAMTGEYMSIKDSSAHHQQLVDELQAENTRLRSIVDEQLQDKKRRDQQLDNIEKEVHIVVVYILFSVHSEHILYVLRVDENILLG